ncbi:MAG: ABC transporter permease [Treponema sp.]|jgi:NitT/TauT family transport system permease protein|nr:ABC transporter permease [Treponema sp.]
MKKNKKDLQALWAPIVFLVIIVSAMEFFLDMTGIPKNILPKPSHIAVSTAESFVKDILPYFLATVRYTLTGICIAIPLGILAASLFSQFRILVKAMTPYLILLVVTPMITMIPLLKLWMGLNPNIRIVSIVILAAPIIALNTLNGFINIESSKIEVMRSLGASRLQIFMKAVFPNALPQVFTGIKLGCIFGTLAAVAADFVLQGQGIGVRILQYSRYLLTDKIFGCIVLLAIIGYSLFMLVSYIEKKVIVWKI